MFDSQNEFIIIIWEVIKVHNTFDSNESSFPGFYSFA